MKNLNAFISDILTIDYSCFWINMEVVDSIRETRVQINENYWGIEMDWHSVTFKPFSETEIGLEYANRFAHSVSPKTPSVEYVQFALTDLLCLPDEQRRTQVNRLSDFVQLWGNNGYAGVQSSYSRLHDAFDLIPGIQLNEFDDWLKDHQIITKNLPVGSNKIHLRDRFYHSFVWYVGEKVNAVERLMNGVEISYSYSTKQSTPPTGKISGGPEQPAIFINNDARTNLLSELIIYIEESNQAELSELINGKPISEPIIVNCRQNILGKVFYENYVKGCTQASKAAFAKWICQHFRRQTDGQLHKLTESTMMNHLKGRDLNAS